MMFFIFTLIVILFHWNSSQTIKHLNEISVKEESPIGSFVTSLTDKIPNLDQSIEYDLVTPLSTDLDLFSIDHLHHSLVVKNRIDYEYICLKRHHCTISVSIAVSNDDTIDVYILPIRIMNINDNPIRFLVNRTVIEMKENDEQWLNRTYPLPHAYDDDEDPIRYSIYLQNWSKPDGLFDFDEKNLLLKPLRKFDREEQNIYLLRLIAHNQNDISIDIIILIKDVNDNPPICHSNRTLFLISNISKISVLSLNVTDLDEGDNSKLEYHFINPLPGFSIDRYSGLIKFDDRQWIRSNETILIVNITDHGKPVRLSTKCFIEMKFPSLIEIDFYSNYSMIKHEQIYLDIPNLHFPIGQFRIFDKQENRSCIDCTMSINSSMKEIFSVDYSSMDLYLNVNSMILMRILTNYSHAKENLSVHVPIEVMNRKNPSIKSMKNYSFVLQLNKMNFLISSNILFLKIEENSFLNQEFSIFNHYHPCLNDITKDLMVIDPTNTFEIDQKLNLILKKYLNSKQQNIYHLNLREKANNNSTNEVSLINLCSIQLHICVINPYSIENVYPYFSQAFYILSSKNLSQFYLPALPFYVKYQSSVPELISINPLNASIVIRSSSLYSSYYYDFQIEVIDSRVPSLSSSAPVRIFFGVNNHPPRLLMNFTRQTMEISSSKFLYQIRAYDPDIPINEQMNFFPPTIEYTIDSAMNNIEIERYTGRIFTKYFNITKVNFTLIMTDFGQPDRLTTRDVLTFDIKSEEKISIAFLIIISLVFVIILLLIVLFLVINCCCTTHRNSSKAHEKPTWKNISPTAPDTRLIDNEYITTTTSSLPRVCSREQRIYPPMDRKNFSHSSLDRIAYPYSTEKKLIEHEYNHRVSVADVNKYLERFEKIYHDSSSQQYLHQPIGSVV